MRQTLLTNQALNNYDDHLLIVDDDNRIRELIKDYLLEQSFYISTASSAVEARIKLKNFSFSLIILDIMMPGEDGLSLTKSIRKNNEVPILLLTARGDPKDRILGFESGADDYLAKPFEPRELLLRVKSILKRNRINLNKSKSRISMGNVSFDLNRGELFKDNKIVKITSTELTLLKILASKKGKTVARHKLSNDTGVSERSIDVQVTRLRKKIEIDPKNPRFLQTVWGSGYSLIPD
ncbi:MAG: DNA-binding response regulator [Rhodospirillaceae bacterium]|nr:DNA-binding response regulator [Rhodospirillaceae bacterium]|tara:strand:- start:1445 stop:2155 length:711 start_codon:yes stop_codon:yes gene_type:complete